jgi:phosphoglycerol transferase
MTRLETLELLADLESNAAFSWFRGTRSPRIRMPERRSASVKHRTSVSSGSDGSASRDGGAGKEDGMATGGTRLKIAGVYIVTVLLCLGILTWVLKLWNASLGVPFSYWEDGLFYSMVVKGIIDGGWCLHNGFLGMPQGMDLHDMPFGDNLQFLLIKLISWVSHDYAVVLNSYYLIGYPLTALTALFVLRHFKISFGPAMVGSLLFTFLPYHMFRGEAHLLLSSYYMIPVMVMVILWILLEEDLVLWTDTPGHKMSLNLSGGKSVASIIICVLAASAGIYYAFFACFLLIVAGTARCCAYRKIQYLIAALALVTVISMGIVLNVMPSIVYRYEHGRNREADQRGPWESELYGLKIVQLILPVAEHRIPSLAKLRNKYDHGSPLVNENGCASLGTVGSVGFLGLLGWFLFGERCSSQSKLFSSLGLLTIGSVLLGTIGGFGTVFAYFISPQIRGYNRISIFIAFFSIFAVALLLDKLPKNYVKSHNIRVVYYAMLGLILVLGILDQTNTRLIPDYSHIKQDYTHDKNFISKIEASLPQRAMVFQLPYVPFPENPSVNKMEDYALLRGYLHSSSLRWSYGAMKGRETDRWQREVTRQPLKELVSDLAVAGFSGIYIDRQGYADGGASLEAGLAGLLKAEPMVSDNQRLAFFRITGQH